MTTSALTQILYLFDDAFSGDDWQSLLTNLGSVTPDEWVWVPLGARRSISYIVRHIGASKSIYQNHAFGDAGFTWEGLHAVGDSHVETSCRFVIPNEVRNQLDQAEILKYKERARRG